MSILTTELAYRRILCPVDFSDTARKAFYQAVGYSKLFRAELIIFHVDEDNLSAKGYESVEQQSAVLERLEDGLIRRLGELQADGHVSQEDRDRITFEVGGGKPWLAISRYARERECDLIIMGTHGLTGLKHMFIGSQAEKVVRRAHCHVLCVKPDDYAPELPDPALPS